ncbi:Uncharacterized protein family Ycf2 [Cynara cardunculus var. scolymus]|uniref:Uncharacterized protein family Ycf2 n=1 Tax=Cynara cardunculus var. scolymus TaxID=59895 RepID=A0A103YLD6_CYNCS|nr:Uncharacterized protein family Ycf2 [Cynara cardunculus var. scolymus]
MYRTFQRDSASSILSKWNLFQSYIPWFFTSTGNKYLIFLLLDTFSDLSSILSSSQKFILCMHQIYHGEFFRKLFLSSTMNLISEFSSKCFHNLLMFEEMIHRNNESSMISTHLTNVREFLYAILFLLLVVSYRQSSKKVKSFIITSSMIKLQKLLDRYPTSEPSSFWLKNIFLVVLKQLGDCLLLELLGGGPAYRVKSIRSKKKYLNINLIYIIDLISIIKSHQSNHIFEKYETSKSYK